MKKILIRTSLVLLLVFGMAYNAYAIPITGGISFAGAVTPDNNDLTLAQQLTFSSQSFVTTAVGSYAGKAGTSVTVASPLVFDPPTQSVQNLWRLTNFAGWSFDATSMIVSDRFADSVDIRGTGIAHIPNFDATNGIYIFTINSLGGTFSYSASNTMVPEPLTLILLGSGLLGLFGLRRKLS